MSQTTTPIPVKPLSRPRSGAVKSVRAVQEALQQLNHATAQEIFEWIQRSPRNPEVSLTSVYRALNVLVEQVEVKPLHFNDGQVRYELNTRQMHHHHFVCTRCNHIQMIDVCPYESLAHALGDQFFIQYHTFEVFGLCRDCVNEQSERDPSIDGSRI